MLKKNNQTIGTIYKGSTPIEKIYKGNVLVWEGWKKLIAQGIPPLTLTKCKENKLLNYQIYGNSKQIKLPSAYQEVEYLKSTGTQYIDSGMSINDKDFKISCDFEQTMNTGGGEQALFSIWTGSYNYWNCFTVYYDIRVYTAGHHMIREIITTGKRGKVIVERNSSSWELKYENQSIQWNYTPSVVNPTTLKIFTRGDTPGQGGSNTHVKMYSLIIEINGKKEADFIPCYRKSDNKPGMYDLVSQTFFTNQGTGEFIIGPEIPNPDSPIEIESVGDKTKNLYAGNNEYTVSEVTNATPREWYVMEASKTYTIAMYIDNSKGTGSTAFRMSVGKSGGWDYWRSNVIAAGSKGWARTTITVDTTYNNNLNMQYQPVGEATFSKIMLLEGSYTVSNLPEYEPYGYKIPLTINNTTTNIYLDEPLRKVGDYADYADFENQKVYRNVKMIDVKGNENWRHDTNRDNDTTMYLYSNALASTVKSGLSLKTANGMCNSFKVDTIDKIYNKNTTTECIGVISSTNGFRIRINKSRLVTEDLDGFNQWLRENPFEFCYPLETPAEESIELPDILLNKGTNVVDIETSITPSNLWLKYKGKEG